MAIGTSPSNSQLNKLKARESQVRLTAVELPIWANGLLWALVTCVFVGSPYRSGLYFYNHLQPFAIGITAVAGILGIWLWGSRSQIYSKNIWLTFLPYSVLLGLVYILNVFMSPTNTAFAVEGVIRQLTTLGIVFVLTVLLQTIKARKVFLGMLLLTGAWTSLFGLAAGYGTIHFNGAIMQPGNRLASVFQYANTNASFAAAFAFISFFFPLLIRQPVLKVLTAIDTYLLLLNLTLSYSRGTWITFAVLAMVLIVLLPKVNRLPLILANIPAFLVFAATLGFQTKAVQGVIAKTGWESLVVGIAATAILSYVIHVLIKDRKLTVPLWGKWAISIVVIVGIIAVGFKMIHGSGGNSILSRIAHIGLKDHSVQERFIYYSDGIKMFMLHPVLGNGYDAWQALFEKYRSFPYFSKHEHSYWIQLLIETGVIGTALFVIAIVFYIRSIISVLKTKVTDANNVSSDVKNVNSVGGSTSCNNEQLLHEQKIISWISLFVVTSILAHASIDFDLSYSLLNFMLWGMIIVGISDVRLVQRNKGFSVQPLSGWLASAYGLGIVSMVAGLGVSITSLAADTYYQESAKSTNPQLGLEGMNNAKSLAGYNSQYSIAASQFADQMYMQTKDVNYAKTALLDAQDAVKHAPYDSATLMSASQLSYRYSQFDQALNYLNRAVDDSKYGQSYVEQYMVYLVFRAEESIKKNPTLTKRYSNTILKLWNDSLDKVKQIQDLPSYLPPESQFTISDQMKLRASEAYVMLGQAYSAKPMVQELIHSKDGTIALTSEMLWNVMLEKHMVKGQAYNAQQQISANQDLKYEYELLK